jgi:sirohydrochlorin ferrochelatase
MNLLLGGAQGIASETVRMRPALVALARGSRDGGGPEVIAQLLDDVRGRLPGVDVISAWLEPGAAGLREVMAQLERPAVLVPLLLSTGYRATIDVPAAVALSGAAAHLAAPLGPDRHLARAMTARLREAGAVFGDAVLLVAPAPREPGGKAAIEQAAELLRSEWGPRVAFAFASAGRPDVPTAVGYLRHAGTGRVWVAPYSLVPGRFARRVGVLAAASGVSTVASVLGGHRLVTDVVVLRYQEGVAESRGGLA